METAKVSSKYQIVIPKKVRDALGIKKDDVVVFEITQKRVMLKKFDELLERHIGSVKLDRSFRALRKEFDEEMARGAVH